MEIALPKSLEPGTFCVEYCVYDKEQRVSNIVEVCIDVVSLEEKTANFLQLTSGKCIMNIMRMKAKTCMIRWV